MVICVLAMMPVPATQAVAADLQPQCDDNRALVHDILQREPRPLGMAIALDSDYMGGRLLQFRTDHALGHPAGLPFREGREQVTYYAYFDRRVCQLPLDEDVCPELKTAREALQSKSYAVMPNRVLRPNGTFHPSIARFRARDGDGSLISIQAAAGEHPLFKDVSAAFSSIARCTREADREAFQF